MERPGEFDSLLLAAFQRADVPLPTTLNDVSIARLLAASAGVSMTTRESALLVRRMVRQMRREYESGHLEALSYAGRSLQVQEVCAKIAPVLEGPRYFAALGYSVSAGMAPCLPTDRLGLDYAGADIDVDACAWRWVYTMVLTIALRLMNYLELDEPCIHDFPEEMI